MHLSNYFFSATSTGRPVYRLYYYREEDDEFVEISDYAALSKDKTTIVAKKLKSRRGSKPDLDFNNLTLENTLYVKTTYNTSDAGGRIQKRFCEVLLAPDKFKVNYRKPAITTQHARGTITCT